MKNLIEKIKKAFAMAMAPSSTQKSPEPQSERLSQCTSLAEAEEIVARAMGRRY